MQYKEYNTFIYTMESYLSKSKGSSLHICADLYCFPGTEM